MYVPLPRPVVPLLLAVVLCSCERGEEPGAPLGSPGGDAETGLGTAAPAPTGRAASSPAERPEAGGAEDGGAEPSAAGSAGASSSPAPPPGAVAPAEREARAAGAGAAAPADTSSEDAAPAPAASSEDGTPVSGTTRPEPAPATSSQPPPPPPLPDAETGAAPESAPDGSGETAPGPEPEPPGTSRASGADAASDTSPAGDTSSAGETSAASAAGETSASPGPDAAGTGEDERPAGDERAEPSPATADAADGDGEPRGGDVPALRAEQIARGLPGSRPGQGTREVRQVLTVAADGQRILLEQYGSPAPDGGPRVLERRLILRLDLDPPVTWDLAPDGTRYREYEGDLNRYQKERDIRELELIRKARRLPAKEREYFLEKNHLRLDGEREVRVEWGDTKTVLGHPTRRLLVTENGRTIIDCYVAERIGVARETLGGRGFFRLYRRLGAFSEEVLEKIRDVSGLPLKGSITVVTKLSVHEFEFEVQEIEEVEVAPGVFELPPGAEEVEETPEVLTCPVCGERFESQKGEKLLDRGRIHWFCSRECKREHQRQILEELEDGE